MNYMCSNLITLTIGFSWADIAEVWMYRGWLTCVAPTAPIGALQLIYRLSLSNFVVREPTLATESGSPMCCAQFNWDSIPGWTHFYCLHKEASLLFNKSTSLKRSTREAGSLVANLGIRGAISPLSHTSSWRSALLNTETTSPYTLNST
jgi:hypothetical protein